MTAGRNGSCPGTSCLSGSALHEAVVAGPQGSTFVQPSTLSPSTAKTPIGVAMAGNNLD